MCFLLGWDVGRCLPRACAARRWLRSDASDGMNAPGCTRRRRRTIPSLDALGSAGLPQRAPGATRGVNATKINVGINNGFYVSPSLSALRAPEDRSP